MNNEVFKISADGKTILDCCEKNKKVIVVPDGITTIAKSAFWGHKDLEKIIFPESLEGIGESAFWGCINLRNLLFDATKFCNHFRNKYDWNCSSHHKTCR